MIRRLLSLNATDAALLTQALPLVAAARLALWTLPSRVLLGVVERYVARRAGAESRIGEHQTREQRRIAWAIRAAARRVPQASCLTQALAGRVLLARYGYPSALRVGVARGEAGSLLAHAWVETAAGAIIGNTGLGQYRQLPNLQQALR